MRIVLESEWHIDVADEAIRPKPARQMPRECNQLMHEPRTSAIHQVSYVISIRSEYRPSRSPVFHGTLETVAGQKFEFKTLAELNSLLCEIGGWIDGPAQINAAAGQK